MMVHRSVWVCDTAHCDDENGSLHDLDALVYPGTHHAYGWHTHKKKDRHCQSNNGINGALEDDGAAHNFISTR